VRKGSTVGHGSTACNTWSQSNLSAIVSRASISGSGCIAAAATAMTQRGFR